MMEHDQNPQEGSAHEVPSQDLEATTLETATAETPAVTTADEPVAAEESAQGIEFENDSTEVAATEPAAPTAEPASDVAAESTSDESDDHTEEEREAHEDHSADYSEMSDEELLAEAARVLREVPIADARVPMLALRNTLLPRLDEERQAALDAFVAEGGNAIDFHYEQKVREKFYETYNEFKKRRGAWKAEQERALALHLADQLGGDRVDRDHLVENLPALLLDRHAVEDVAAVDVHVVDHAGVNVRVRCQFD